MQRLIFLYNRCIIHWLTTHGIIAQLVEHLRHMQGATGSSPVNPTIDGDCAFGRKKKAIFVEIAFFLSPTFACRFSFWIDRSTK